MGHSDRLVGHVLLPLAELLALPVSIVATAVVLFVGSIALHAVRFVGVLVAVVSDVLASTVGIAIPVVTIWNDLVNAGVVLATVLALLSLGGVAVSTYWRVFESFDDRLPETVVLVPLVGIAPALSQLVTTGTMVHSWWSVAFTALWAHALAYRTIAYDGLVEERRRNAFFAGCLVALPAVVTEIVVVTDLLGPSGVFDVPTLVTTGEVIASLLAGATAARIVPGPTILVFFPLGVSLLIALARGRRVVATLDRRSLSDLSIRPWAARSGSDASEPWVPSSPSPTKVSSSEPVAAESGTSDAAGSDPPAGDEAGGPDSVRSESSSGTASSPKGRSHAAGAPSSHSPPDDFGDTQIFTHGGALGGDPAGDDVETCPECGGRLSTASHDFCPHCGADR